MTDNEAAKQRADMANALLDVSESMGPIFDTAEGMKADLERRGWSPTAAETAALTWLTGALNHVWRSAK